jgi:hypothetical protein
MFKKKPPLFGAGVLKYDYHIFNSKDAPRWNNDHADNNVNEDDVE